MVFEITDTIKSRFNEISNTQINEMDERSYYLEILSNYGVCAVGQNTLVREAKKNIKENKNLDVLIDKFNITFNKKKRCYSFPLQSLLSNGIFIPEHLDRTSERVIPIFDNDFMNVINGDNMDDWPDYRTSGYDFVKDKFKPSYLENQDYLKSGFEFSQKMWKPIFLEYQRKKSMDNSIITELGDELVSYFNKLINKPF